MREPERSVSFCFCFCLNEETLDHVLVLKGEVEVWEQGGNAGAHGQGWNEGQRQQDYLCLRKTPCTQPCYMQSAQSTLFFIVLVT